VWWKSIVMKMKIFKFQPLVKKSKLSMAIKVTQKGKMKVLSPSEPILYF